MPGDTLEVRGPIGYFAWDSKTPVLGVAGGSGVVPLMAMLRAARRDGHPGLIRLVVSVRTPADLYYSRELTGPDAAVVYTRQVPAGFSRPAGRLTLADLAPAIRGHQVAYLCGSSAFCDSAASLLRDLEVPAACIRVERFGPSG